MENNSFIDIIGEKMNFISLEFINVDNLPFNISAFLIDSIIIQNIK